MNDSIQDTFRPVSYSRTILTELMIPSYANFGGKIHGGTLLSLMDKVAYACASKHSGRYCVTVSVDGVEFLEPVEVGEMVYMQASVNHVGRSSLVVGIRVLAENFLTGKSKHTNTCYFTMVAKDENGKPTQVPGLALETQEDVRRFAEAIIRKDLKRHFNRELDNAKTTAALPELMKMLVKERCRIDWDNGTDAL